ncbi:MAG: ATP phosphoribosyltransferase regulatory subunit [Alphaproteobacteria bacterium]|nr:ATP phosphoribosyltransferase regulatory subunit [Alphaproteobacteria bacterium]
MVTSADKALLPDGLRDSLPPAAGHEAAVHEALLATFVARGFERVDPPLVEFEDSLLDGAGESVALSTFRLMDPVSQRMMGVRADMTPQVARIALTRLRKAPRPLRLCYGGSVLRVRGSQLQPEREFRQAGVELVGADEATADIEVILLAQDALQAAGAQRLTVDLTLPALVPAIFDRCKLDDGVRAELRAMLARKDAAGVAEIGGKAAADLQKLLAAAGSATAALKALAAISFDGKAASELARLVAVVAALERKAPDLAITVDPVENRGFEYHSGLSFTFFAGGVRGELGCGGRYLAGGGEPATGFSLFLHNLLRALPAPSVVERLLLPIDADRTVSATLRGQGWITVEALVAVPDLPAEARRLNCTHCLVDGEIVSIEEKGKQA